MHCGKCCAVFRLMPFPLCCCYQRNETNATQVLFLFYGVKDMTSAERHEARYKRRVEARLQKRIQANAQYDNFESVCSADNLLYSYFKCRKGVQWKESVQRYESELLLNISKTRKQLLAGEFRGKGFVQFQIHERGKVRDIKAVHISERVVQRSLCDNSLVPILRRSLIYDNGASLKGRGIDFTKKRLVEHLRQHIRTYGRKGYILIMDFKKYFDSIKHTILYEQLLRYITDNRIIALYKLFVDAFGENGLGLGSQVSQIFALFYVNRFDHFVKEVLRIKHYGRYMDDCYIICATKKRVNQILGILIQKCREFGLSFNERKVSIHKLKRGFCFLKTYFTIKRTGKIKKRPLQDNIRRQYKRINTYAMLLAQGKMTFKDIRNSYQSWRGYMRGFNSYFIVGRMNKYYYTKLLQGGNANDLHLEKRRPSVCSYGYCGRKAVGRSYQQARCNA